MNEYDKRAKLINSMVKLEDELISEGNPDAANGVATARFEINSLKKAEVARLYDIIKNGR